MLESLIWFLITLGALIFVLSVWQLPQIYCPRRTPVLRVLTRCNVLRSRTLYIPERVARFLRTLPFNRTATQSSAAPAEDATGVHSMDVAPRCVLLIVADNVSAPLCSDFIAYMMLNASKSSIVPVVHHLDLNGESLGASRLSEVGQKLESTISHLRTAYSEKPIPVVLLCFSVAGNWVLQCLEQNLLSASDSNEGKLREPSSGWKGPLVEGIMLISSPMVQRIYMREKNITGTESSSDSKPHSAQVREVQAVIDILQFPALKDLSSIVRKSLIPLLFVFGRRDQVLEFHEFADLASIFQSENSAAVVMPYAGHLDFHKVLCPKTWLFDLVCQFATHASNPAVTLYPN